MFRYITSTLAACALAGVVSVSAQQPAPAPAQQPEKQQAPKETITGCVMEAKTTDGGTAYVNPKVLRPPAVQVESVKVVADECK
jgi:hypothetical protein